MAKNYDITSKSDMDRFTKDLMADIMDIATEEVRHMTYTVNCPVCGCELEAIPGHNTCPKCKEDIELNLEIQ